MPPKLADILASPECDRSQSEKWEECSEEDIEEDCEIDNIVDIVFDDDEEDM